MLDDLFAPLSLGEFLKNYWPGGFLHLPGPSGRFTELFPWPALSQALECQRFSDRRLRLVKSARDIAPERYLNGSRIDAGKLAMELSDGATLIFNNCEEVHPPLRDLCASLERLFHHRVYTNLYAGWRADNGFDVHWDAQNNFIVQVAGRKRWKVWKPTRAHPLREEVDSTLAPSEEPFWDGVLEQGSLLFIPRGWWHIAYPMDEPCLHLTVTLPSPTGIDLLHWLADRMKSSEVARSDVPMAGTESARAEWLAEIRADLLAALDGDTIDRFMADQDARIPRRPRISLPDDVARRPVVFEKSMSLRLIAPELLRFASNGDKMVCTAGDTMFPIDADVGEKMRILNDRRPHSVEELSPRSDVRFKALIGAMVMKGILKRVDSSAG
jgi:ribosomal protein L16 Arg81 hydroxylase